ncbi:MAG: hypothetical protein HWE16_10810 [Gammaproteobacteria bacterium]|nr:hypothetical protein [Gammaproteobacteria bacterium]
MRKEHREDEAFAQKHLEMFLSHEKSCYKFDLSHKDKPDLLFLKDNERRIGCELVTITVEKLMKWTNTKSKIQKDHVYKISIPYEPHMWIQKAIIEKNKKIDGYIKNANLDECWLLLHCGDNSRNWFYKNEEYLLNVYTYIASNLKHRFVRVLFLYRDQLIYELKTEEGAKLPAPKYPITQKGFRTIEISEIPTVLTNHDRTIEISKLPVADEIKLPFLDPTFKIKRNV